jgi:hypothetical protein
MDWGVSYRLMFGAGTRHFPTVSVNATGCREITGAGRNRWAQASSFWTILGKAVNVADPGTKFPGCDPQGGMACPQNATYNA